MILVSKHRLRVKVKGLILSAVLLSVSAGTAMALEDGWYRAKEATGSCSNDLKDAVLAIQGNRPLSLSAEGQSATFIDPVQIDKKPRKMKAVAARGTGIIEVYVNSDKTVTVKVIDAQECLGAKIVFTP